MGTVVIAPVHRSNSRDFRRSGSLQWATGSGLGSIYQPQHFGGALGDDTQGLIGYDRRTGHLPGQMVVVFVQRTSASSQPAAGL